MDLLQQQKRAGHGQYREVTEEKEVVQLSACVYSSSRRLRCYMELDTERRNEPRCVVHFFHYKFKRCEIMDKHLQQLATKYFDTLFIRVFVENVPWLVERLGVKVLPCVITFVNGTSKDRCVPSLSSQQSSTKFIFLRA